MTVLITNVKPKMFERFMETDMCHKHFAWLGMANGEADICLGDSEYTLESGMAHTGREFITIRSGNEYFTVYNGEYDTIIME